MHVWKPNVVIQVPKCANACHQMCRCKPQDALMQFPRSADAGCSRANFEDILPSKIGRLWEKINLNG